MPSLAEAEEAEEFTLTQAGSFPELIPAGQAERWVAPDPFPELPPHLGNKNHQPVH